jgi:ABC-2 type transport system permease protein
MRTVGATLRAELVGAGGVVERNFYLTKRYIWWDLAWFFWTVANTLTIVFIAQGVEATGGQIDVNQVATSLLIGAVVWAYLGVLFEFLMETVAWERWEGTIEYTFMAPLSRAMHLAGQGLFAISYGLLRAVFLFIACALFFDLSMPDANFFGAFVVLAIASISFIGIGVMTSGSWPRACCSSSPASTTRWTCSPAGCSSSRSSRQRRTRSRAPAGRSRAARRCRSCGVTSGRC